jgi:predicted dehydrogenase
MGEPLKIEVNHFLECIEEGKRPLSSGPEGLAVVKTLDAITRSLAAGGSPMQV